MPIGMIPCTNDLTIYKMILWLGQSGGLCQWGAHSVRVTHGRPTNSDL